MMVMNDDDDDNNRNMRMSSAGVDCYCNIFACA